jgi:Na+-driven multidrug efflux pump
VVIFVNNQLYRYGGDMAVGAYGISNAVATVFVMFVIGLNQGMQPIAGYNYGAQQLTRLMRVVRLAIIAATCIMSIGWLVAMFMPSLIARAFTTDAKLISQAIVAIRFNLMVFPIIGFQMVTTNFFQCIGKVKISIFLSLSRQMLLLLPLLGILPMFIGLNGVWLALPSSDFLSALLAFTVMTIFMRKFKKQIIAQEQSQNETK